MSLDKKARDNKRRNDWQVAGYPRDMGSALVVPPPKCEYRRLYYLTSAEHAVSSLAFHRVKIARLNELNDPFELLAARSSSKSLRKKFNDFKDSQNNRIGLLCFSGNWTNPVLWSHYGNRHKGICLGFDVLKKHANDVQYVKERLELKFYEGESALTAKLKHEILHTKFDHWSYEWEFRKVVDLTECISEGGLKFFKFNSSLKLKEIILGHHCTVSETDVLDFLSARYNNVAVFKSRLAFKTFNVVPREDSVRKFVPNMWT